MSFPDNPSKKKCVMFVDQVKTADISPEDVLDQVSLISYQSSEESLTTSSKFLSDQLEVLKKNLEIIESSVESQLLTLQAFSYAETDDLELRIRSKIQKLNEEKKLKENPGCCTNGCLVQ